MKSPAIIFSRPNEVEIGEVEVPDALGPTDVLVRTQHSGLSTGTERWLLTGRFHRAVSPVGGERSFPLVPGYQKVGVVERVGREVRAFTPGDRVFCTVGQITAGAKPRDANRARGGHLLYSVQDQTEVISVPARIDARAVAGLVLVQVGWNGASRPPLRPGDAALVVGDGLVGQYAAQALRARGARVLLSGRRPFRLDLARRYSADAVHHAWTEGELARAVERFTAEVGPRPPTPPGLLSLPEMSPAEAALRDGRAESDARGVDVVVDTTGSREAVRQEAGLLRHNGHLVLLSWYPEPENELLEDWLHGREIAMYGTGGYRRPRLLATLAAIADGQLRPGELVTHHAPVTEAPRLYRELLLEKREDFLGVVFDWEGL
ncbi:MAG: zinc-binding alcohol dehydrogenase [Chloroflexi bacterium]|nr:zinc-binding alcohol dehydrogenase [Chloroflexota bacterium]